MVIRISRCSDSGSSASALVISPRFFGFFCAELTGGLRDRTTARRTLPPRGNEIAHAPEADGSNLDLEVAIPLEAVPPMEGREGTQYSGREGLFSVRVEEDSDALAVHAVGELDIGSAQLLERALRHAMEGEASSVILDFAEVSFIDSMGLRTLLWAAQHSREKEDSLRIRIGSGPVGRMIDLTGLQRAASDRSGLLRGARIGQ
jgi:anti-sigma B factor antagonist